MHIDKYKQPDGWYKDEDGTDYETAVDFLSSKLDFCGCGMPEQAIKYVARVLRLIYDHTERDSGTEGVVAWSKESYDRMCSFAKTDGERYFVWYVLDSKELIEHGGSVPGWLTGKGLEFMEDVESLNIEDR